MSNLPQLAHCLRNYPPSISQVTILEDFRFFFVHFFFFLAVCLSYIRFFFYHPIQ
ncbi:hypothetical protein K450DRAFT_252594 [Umbelopsis ramanniana AG]|uniref:Uncharacterized protein n=1 Tax=Umbelopsis ramanniana AG TaxID=1314678 RepID=A0AAD5HAQ3_UMBRA|nr:uncharacterized protein K450DRAFT_252594 [Umbelopsis ramanniana AG]KAI8577320.1 hypothetical protein K450DRAFT_252594 [Umbelopsis ramanniana AG]